MISIDELEKILDGKAEAEFSRLLEVFNRAVREAKGGKVNIEFKLRAKCFYINGRCYDGYSAESILRLVGVLKGEGWPVHQNNWFDNLTREHQGLFYPEYVVDVFPYTELKRRVRQSRKGKSAVGDFLVMWGEYPSMRALVFTLLGSVTMLAILAKVTSC